MSTRLEKKAESNSSNCKNIEQTLLHSQSIYGYLKRLSKSRGLDYIAHFDTGVKIFSIKLSGGFLLIPKETTWLNLINSRILAVTPILSMTQ